MAVRRLTRFCTVLAVGTAALAFAAPSFAATFTVTSTADDGSPGTLRYAITNAHGGDTITFDLQFGHQEIDLLTPLPEIAQSITVDGSVPGTINGPQAPRIDGAALGITGEGLVFHAGIASTVRGLTLTRFGKAAIDTGVDPVNVFGNFIGTDAGSASGLGNGIGVLSIGSVNIGSSAASDRNVISGNTTGISLSGGSDADVQGNYIGTNVAGTAPVGNGTGILLDGTSSDHIGGAAAGQGNLISGNTGSGIQLQSGAGGNQIYGNLIGTRADGKTGLGNGVGIADSQSSMANNVFGDSGPGQANTIAFNTGAGVSITGTGRGDRIEGNSMFSNGGLGIDLGGDGVTANDPGDGDTGPNELQNFPDLATAVIGPGGHPQVTGTVTSSVSTTNVLDFYASTSCDPSGHGEGTRFLGSFGTITLGAFDTGSTLPGTVGPGEWITATTTDTFGDTSEFSTCIKPAATATYTVNTTNDPDPTATPGCDATECSLREAIEALNASGTAGIIDFKFGAAPAPHVFGIDPNRLFPPITEPVTIDGLQGGVPSVVLNAGSYGIQGYSFLLDLAPGSGGSDISGLVVRGMACPDTPGQPCNTTGTDTGPGAAIAVESDGNTIENSWIGTNDTGTALVGNKDQNGIIVTGSNNTIQNNVISGSVDKGVWLRAPGSHNVVSTNLIGTDKSGQSPLPNDVGIQSDQSPGTVVGGPAPADGNVISSGTTGVAINDLSGASDGAIVKYNSIGVTADGVTSLTPIGGNGVEVSHADGVTIDNNVIGNADDGIAPTSSKNLTISNNIIGLSRSGSFQHPTHDFGIFWNGNALDGASAGVINGNWISANDLGGIALQTVDGVTMLANDVTNNGHVLTGGAGIQVNGNNNVIEANTVTGNGSSPQDPGVTIEGGSGNLIRQNLIDNNAGLGITLVGAGNNNQGAPLMAAATGSGGNDVHVTGTYHGIPNSSYTLDFYASPLPDPSGSGEGGQYVGFASVGTDEVGNAGFDTTVSASLPVPAGSYITATATDPTNGTSQFSNAVQASAPSGSSVTLTPTDDAEVNRTAPNVKYGSFDYADVYGGDNPAAVLANGTSYMLMKFNLSSIPAGATITGIHLDMTSRAGFAQDGDPLHWALFVPSNAWDEGTVDWTNRPSDGVPNVGDPTTPGGDIRGSSTSFGAANAFWASGAVDFSPEGPKSPVFPSSNADGFLPVPQAEQNFITHAQESFENPGSQFSLELWTPNCATGCLAPNYAYWVRYYTKEAANPLFRPQLVVDYTLAPPAGTISLTASPTAKAPGTVPLANVPPSAFFNATSSVTSAPLGSVPLGSVPLGSVPLASVPLGSVPLGSVPLASVPLASVGGRLLGSIPLSTIPLAPPHSWAEVLAGSAFDGLPLQNVTLGQVLGDASASGRLNALPLGSVDLSRTPLGSVPLASVPLASVPLASVPVAAPDGSTPGNPLDAWCAWFHGPPINCTQASDLNGQTVLSAALDGAPLASVPLASVPLASVPLASVPLASVPLASVPLGSVNVVKVNINYSPLGSVPLASVPLGSVPLGSVPLASVDLTASPLGSVPLASVDPTICGGFCPGSFLRDAQGSFTPGTTLAQLFAAIAPHFAPNMTLAQLISSFSDTELEHLTLLDLVSSLPTPNTFTYADLLALLVQSNDLNWETFDLHATPVGPFATDGTAVHYTATFTVTADPGTTTSVAKVSVTLPAGAGFKPGSAQLFKNAVLQPAPGNPSKGDLGALDWTLALDVGTTYTLQFDAFPSPTTGPQSTSATITPTDASTTAAPSDPTTDVSDAFPAHNTPTSAVHLGAGNFYLSHLGTPGDVNFYTFDVPARGSRTTFHLSHLPADYDLVVYGPSGQQLLPTDPSTPPLDGQPLPDAGFGATHTTDALAPPVLNDVPIDGSLPLAGVSTLRGSQDDSVTVVSNGESGQYTVQVSGFNGAASAQPYMLRAEVTPPPVQSGCTARILGSAGFSTTPTETVAGQDPNAVKTLFVVDGQQLQRLYADGSDTLSALTASLPGFASNGFPAAIVHADADPAVRTADAAWNACPGDPGLANGVVSAISQTIRDARSSFPNVEYVVLVGGDDALPFARIDDLTTVSNETGYAETFDRANALGGSLANAQVLTDDPYGTSEPIPFLGRQLDVPDLVLGRLVESPAQIDSQLTAFLNAGAHLHPTTAQTTGYDFLTDGATGVASALDAVGTSDRTLISNVWTAADLQAALLAASPPDILSINAHANHNQFQPAAGTTLFSASTIRDATQTYNGRLVFSMGCHAGLSVFDAFTPGANGLDWAELWAAKGAAAYVANTGFGYGDSDSVAYSEDLNVRFAQEATAGLDSPSGADLTIGEALTVAKQEYKGSLAIVGAYDEKAMAELTFYGLPMYRIGGSAAHADRLAPATLSTVPLAGSTSTAPHNSSALASSFGTDPATGLSTESLTLDKNFSDATDLVTPAGGRGSYYQGSDGQIIEHFRPIEPKGIVPISIANAHGALITELTSRAPDVGGFDPIYARPTVDSSTAEPEVSFDDVAFPSKLQSVTTFKRLQETKQQLVLAQGQFFADDPTDGDSTGTQRLFTHEAATVFSSTSDDFSPPTFSTLNALKGAGTVTFGLDVTDADGASTVKRVVVAYKDSSGPVWHFLELTSSGGERWTGTGALSGTAVQYFAQAVDEHGNVGVSTNKGLFYDATVPEHTGDVLVATHDSTPASGWFTGGVNVDVTINGQPATADNAQVSVDGAPVQPYAPPLTVTGDGLHTVTATSASGTATTAFLIDTHAPIVSITTPADGATLFVGQSVTPQFTCTDNGSGVASCTPSSASIDTSTAGPGSFSVTGTDKAGNQQTATVHYTVKVPVFAFVSAGTLGTNGWYTSTPTVTAEAPKGSTPGTGVVTYTLDGGSSQSYTGPFQILTDGTHNLVFSANGGTANLQVKVDTVKPTVTITSPAGSYPRSQTVLSSVSCSDTTSGLVAACPTGVTVDTSTLGPHTFSVTATDKAGNQRTTTVNYTVTNPTPLSSNTFVFTRGNRIWTYDRSTNQAAQLTGISGRDPGTGTFIDDQATKSPDGTKIVFARRGSTGPSQLYVIDADGRGLAPLTSSGDNTTPAFNATGTRLAWSSNRTGSKDYDIWSQAFSSGAFTGSATNLTNIAGNDTQPAWSPATGANANLIAFASDRKKSQFEIFSMNATTGASQTQLTNDTHTDREPSYSPDGSKIAFSSDRAGGTGGFELYVMGSPNGNTQTRITTLNGTDGSPIWISATQLVFGSQNVGAPGGGLGTISSTGTGLAKLSGSAAGDSNPG